MKSPSEMLEKKRSIKRTFIETLFVSNWFVYNILYQNNYFISLLL